jgi:hypothetical protein
VVLHAGHIYQVHSSHSTSRELDAPTLGYGQTMTKVCTAEWCSGAQAPTPFLLRKPSRGHAQSPAGAKTTAVHLSLVKLTLPSALGGRLDTPRSNACQTPRHPFKRAVAALAPTCSLLAWRSDCQTSV